MLKPIKGFEGLYSITDDGRVYSYHKNNNACLEGRWLKQSKNKKGYLYVTLSAKDGKRTSIAVHRLVALTYIEKTNIQVNHKNGIKTDNRVENLEWCSNRDNTIHAYKNGLKKAKYDKKEVFRLLNEGLSQDKIAKLLKIDQSTVSRVSMALSGVHYANN